MGSLWVPSPSAMNELANGWPSTVPRTLTRPRVPKKAAESGITTYVQPPLLSLFCSFAVNCRFRGSSCSLIDSPFGGFRVCTPITTRRRPKRHRGSGSCFDSPHSSKWLRDGPISGQIHSVLRDIRELTDSPEAYAAELRRRCGGLLSYRYIGRRYASMDLGPEDNTVTVGRDMRTGAGALLLAVLGIASPEGGHMSDLEAVPNPVIHSCQILDPGRDVRRIEMVSEELKRGRQMGYSRSKIVDADQPNRVLALTQGQGISIGTPPQGLERMAANPLQVLDSPDLPPLWQVFGGHRRDDGHWALGELAAEVASPDAALHIGPQFVILETAANDRAAEVAGTDRLQGVSSHVMFVARAKVGPFRVEAEPLAGGDGVIAARPVRHDEGLAARVTPAGPSLWRRSK